MLEGHQYTLTRTFLCADLFSLTSDFTPLVQYTNISSALLMQNMQKR